MQNVQNKDKIVIFLGVTLITFGIILLASNYLSEKVDNAYSYMNNLLLERETEEIYEVQEEVDNLDDTSSFLQNEEKEYIDPYQSYYIGSIEIPKVNIKKGFTDIDSPYNTVNKNVEIVKGSNYPNQPLGNFILAAHSGSSYLAYFRELYKLELGDVAYINYQNKQYTYHIVNIYEQEKTGKIAIYRNKEKTCLTLVTCTKDKKDKQTIYILELDDIKNI